MLVLARIAAASVSGLLLANAYGLHPIWPLAWLAPIPLLVAVSSASRVVAVLCGGLAGATSMVSMTSYFLELGGPAPLAIILVSKALTWALVSLAVRSAAHNLPTAAAVFVFPTLIAGIDTLVAVVSPHGSAGAYAYSQMDFLPVLQVATIGGAPAITFIVMLFASTTALVGARRDWRGAIAPALLIVLALGFGQWRLREPAAPAHTIALAIEDTWQGVPEDWRAVWASYAEAISTSPNLSIQQQTLTMVLPEKIAFLAEADVAEALQVIGEITQAQNMRIVVGFTVEEGGRRFNRAYVVEPSGATRLYDKRHLIPGFESDLTVGERDLVFVADGVRYGVAICKDLDFPALGRSYGRAGIDVMLVPAWDFGRDGWLHGRMAVLRGVEGGYSMVRAPRNGDFTFSDAFGRILHEPDSGAPSDVLVSGRVPMSPGPTLYARIGDVFGWAMLALGSLLVAWTLLTRRRAGQDD